MLTFIVIIDHIRYYNKLTRFKLNGAEHIIIYRFHRLNYGQKQFARIIMYNCNVTHSLGLTDSVIRYKNNQLFRCLFLFNYSQYMHFKLCIVFNIVNLKIIYYSILFINSYFTLFNFVLDIPCLYSFKILRILCYQQ